MVNSHGRFVWYELVTTDVKAATAFYSQGHGLGRVGRVGARKGLYPVRRRKGLDQRADAAAGRRQANGSQAELDRLCRGRRRGRDRRGGHAPWRSRACPADGRFRHQPLFSVHRSADRKARAVQVAQARPAAARAGRAGPRRLARTARRRLGAGLGLLRRPFRLAEIGCRNQRDRHVPTLLGRRADDRRHVHQAPDDPGSLLALLFQRRRHRRDGAARQGGRRPHPGGSDRSRRQAAGSSDARTRRVRYSRWKERGEAARSDISSAPHRAVLPARQAGGSSGKADHAPVSRKPLVACRDQAQTDRLDPRRGIRSRSFSRTDRYWCFRSRSRQVPCRLPSNRASGSIRRRPSG